MKKILLSILVLCAMPVAHAQLFGGFYSPLFPYITDDTIKAPKYEPHLSVSTGFMGSTHGDNRMFTSVAPSLVVRPSNRWTITTGLSLTSDFGLNPNYIATAEPNSLAPLRRNGGTGLVSAYAAAQYQAGDNIWLSAMLYHLGGTYAPLYGFANGNVLDVSATALSAAATFRFKNDNFLHLSFTYVRDDYGTIPFLYHDYWMHGGCYSPYGFGIYASPFCY